MWITDSTGGVPITRSSWNYSYRPSELACTGNSARSQAAEAFVRARGDGRILAFSAGSHPKPLHPNAVRVMASRGIDLAGQRPKHLSTFARHTFSYVITLCDRVRENVPELPGHPAYIH